MKKKGNSKVRLNVRLPAELVKWAKKYASGSHTTVTQLITDHFLKLKDREETGQVDQF